MATRKKEEKVRAAAADLEIRPEVWAALKPASEFEMLDRLKVLLYGRSKSGKSHVASLFRKPLIGLTEHQAMVTIRRANPDAVPILISTPADLFRFKLMAKEAHKHGFDAVIADSITDMQRILRAYYTARQGEKAGKEKTSQESWGLLIDATAKLARDLRDLPIHVVAITLDEEINIENTMVHRPAVSGKKLPNDLCQYFNCVGYVRVTEQERGYRHEVMFRANDQYLVGAPPWLDDVMPPEPLLWISRMTGGEVPKDVQERVDRWEKMAFPADADAGDDDNDDDDDKSTT